MRIVKTSQQWFLFFQANAGARCFGEERGNLSESQRRTISASIQEFQLGESGEGQHIMRQAKRHAAEGGDVDYLAALRLFIAEEIRHSRELRQFMETYGIETVHHTWVDSVFRTLRRAAGLELSIAALVCAEIIAKVYYAALRDATDSTILRALCEQILVDEKAHVQFQCERLAILRRHRSAWSLAWRSIAYAIFFRTTLAVVWTKHGRTLRAGGYGWGRYWGRSLVELRDAMEMMDPRHYAWPADAMAGTAALASSR